MSEALEALCASVRANDPQGLTTLLEQSPGTAGQAREDKISPLYLACWHGFAACAKVLLDASRHPLITSVDARTRAEETPLRVADAPAAGATESGVVGRPESGLVGRPAPIVLPGGTGTIASTGPPSPGTLSSPGGSPSRPRTHSFVWPRVA